MNDKFTIKRIKEENFDTKNEYITLFNIHLKVVELNLKETPRKDLEQGNGRDITDIDLDKLI